MKKIISVFMCIILLSGICASAMEYDKLPPSLRQDVGVFSLDNEKIATINVKLACDDVSSLAARIPYISYTKLYEGTYSLRVSKNLLQDLQAYLNTRDDVLIAEEDIIGSVLDVPNDEYYNRQWYLASTKIPDIWPKITNTESSVLVAVIDTGICTTHPDIPADRIESGGKNFIYGAVETNFEDDNGHGTNVSSLIIAASNNTVGIAGISNNNKIKVLPLKAMNGSGRGSSASVISAIDYAIEKGADIINLSLGFSSENVLLGEAVKRATDAGVIVVAAAGNTITTTYNYPASFENVISVAATDSEDNHAYFSTKNNRVDISAPGKSIYMPTISSSYTIASGTSFSAPIVSGIIALLKLQRPELTPRQVDAILKATADDLGKSGLDDLFGFGKINSLEAFNKDTSDIVHAQSITLNKKTANIKIAEQFQLLATVLPDNATNKNIIWKSSDDTIASVSNNGVVTGIRGGTATITAFTSDGDLHDSCTVRIDFGPFSFSVDKSDISEGLSIKKAFLSTNPITKAPVHILLGDNNSGNSVVLISTNGTSYTETTFADGIVLNDITYTFYNSLCNYIAVGNNGALYYSVNGADWYKESFAAFDNVNFTTLCSDGGGITIVADNGYILYYNEYEEDSFFTPGYFYAFPFPYGTINEIIWDQIYYIAIGEKNNAAKTPFVATSYYGSDTWSVYDYPAYSKFISITNDITKDNQTNYYILTSDGKTLKITGNANENNSLYKELSDATTLANLGTTDADKISYLGRREQLVASGLNGTLLTVSENGAVTTHPLAINDNIKAVAEQNGDVHLITDGGYYLSVSETAKDSSLVPELSCYKASLINSSGQFVSSIPKGEEFTVEFYIKANDITRPHTNDNYKNKYPVTVYFALFEGNVLKDIKMQSTYLDSYGFYSLAESFAAENPNGEYELRIFAFEESNLHISSESSIIPATKSFSLE